MDDFFIADLKHGPGFQRRVLDLFSAGTEDLALRYMPAKKNDIERFFVE